MLATRLPGMERMEGGVWREAGGKGSTILKAACSDPLHGRLDGLINKVGRAA